MCARARRGMNLGRSSIRRKSGNKFARGCNGLALEISATRRGFRVCAKPENRRPFYSFAPHKRAGVFPLTAWLATCPLSSLPPPPAANFRTADVLRATGSSQQQVICPLGSPPRRARVNWPLRQFQITYTPSRQILVKPIQICTSSCEPAFTAYWVSAVNGEYGERRRERDHA